MKRLMMLAILAVSAVVLTGCSGAWPRCSWFRGDECNAYSTPTCDAMPYVTEGMMVGPSTSTPEVLPGPASASPST